MTTKKKMIISMVTLGIAIVAIIAIVIGVLAASNQSVANMFSVSYVANNVNATIAGSYTTQAGVTTNYVPVTFNPEDSETNGELTISNGSPSAVIDEFNTYILFKYSFTNNNSQGGRYLKVTLNRDQFDGENSNLNKHYFISTSGDENYDKVTTYGVSDFSYIENDTDDVTHPGFGLDPKDIYVEPQQTIYYYIVVEIADLTINVDFSTSVSNEPIWILESEDTVSTEWSNFVTAYSIYWGSSDTESTLTVVNPSNVVENSNQNQLFSMSATCITDRNINLINRQNNNSTTLTSMGTLESPDTYFAQYLNNEGVLYVSLTISNLSSTDYLILYLDSNASAYYISSSPVANPSSIINWNIITNEEVEYTVNISATRYVYFKFVDSDPTTYNILNYNISASFYVASTTFKYLVNESCISDMYREDGNILTATADYRIGDSGERVAFRDSFNSTTATVNQVITRDNNNYPRIYGQYDDNSLWCRQLMTANAPILNSSNPYVIIRSAITNLSDYQSIVVCLFDLASMVQIDGGKCIYHSVYSTDTELNQNDEYTTLKNYMSTSINTDFIIEPSDTIYFYQLVEYDDENSIEGGSLLITNSAETAVCFQENSIHVYASDNRTVHPANLDYDISYATQANTNFIQIQDSNGNTNFNCSTENYSGDDYDKYLNMPTVYFNSSNKYLVYGFHATNKSSIAYPWPNIVIDSYSLVYNDYIQDDEERLFDVSYVYSSQQLSYNQVINTNSNYQTQNLNYNESCYVYLIIKLHDMSYTGPDIIANLCQIYVSFYNQNNNVVYFQSANPVTVSATTISTSQPSEVSLFNGNSTSLTFQTQQVADNRGLYQHSNTQDLYFNGTDFKFYKITVQSNASEGLFVDIDLSRVYPNYWMYPNNLNNYYIIRTLFTDDGTLSYQSIDANWETGTLIEDCSLPAGTTRYIYVYVQDNHSGDDLDSTYKITTNTRIVVTIKSIAALSEGFSVTVADANAEYTGVYITNSGAVGALVDSTTYDNISGISSSDDKATVDATGDQITKQYMLYNFNEQLDTTFTLSNNGYVIFDLSFTNKNANSSKQFAALISKALSEADASDITFSYYLSSTNLINLSYYGQFELMAADLYSTLTDENNQNVTELDWTDVQLEINSVEHDFIQFVSQNETVYLYIIAENNSGSSVSYTPKFSLILANPELMIGE